MAESIWPWLGDIHAVAPTHWVGIIVTIASVLCGGLIGIERQRAQKPAGMRTLILICLGSAIFSQASILMAGPNGDRTRIAAQIVSGIGFLGAGAIIRERGLVIGVTTGAGVWATAAVGVIVGSGHVAAGMFFSLLIAVTLAASRFIDDLSSGPCIFSTLSVAYDAAQGRTRLAIQAVLDEHQHDGEVTFDTPNEQEGIARIRYCHVHRHHRSFLGELAALAAVRRVTEC